MPMNLKSDELLTLAAEVLDIESRAVDSLRARLDDTFVAACELCLETSGRVIVIGMGKSGHVGNKIAATLASTGTPAFFVHPAEASHGDLGMITAHDVVLAVSYSGETEEIITILPLVKRMGARLISMTGKARSTLARAADVHLDVSVTEEACPLKLAPTASTTATLAMGDALAVALLKIRGFTAEDFALSHPSGSLGKRLLLQVSDVMRTEDAIPRVSPEVTLRDGLMEMTEKGLGMTAIVAEDDEILGIFDKGHIGRFNVLAEPQIRRGVFDAWICVALRRIPARCPQIAVGAYRPSPKWFLLHEHLAHPIIESVANGNESSV